MFCFLILNPPKKKTFNWNKIQTSLTLTCKERENELCRLETELSVAKEQIALWKDEANSSQEEVVLLRNTLEESHYKRKQEEEELSKVWNALLIYKENVTFNNKKARINMVWSN